MQISSGTRLGSYEITGELGAGGMGEVYRAHDPKLERDVAIKVLPPDFAQNPERLARFEREAKALAALNHPNIATVYGFEQDESTHFLVMEVAEGEDLAERLKRSAIPVDEAIPVFLQIAEGLEAAHEKGIIHRDLKPANIMVSDDGRARILDFGLAKAIEPDPLPGGDLTQSPTMTAAATMRGKIMGTAAYMSPEQASGKAVDKRTDIWAFGACLYEALSGRRAFEGDDAPNTLASVLRDTVDTRQLPEDCPEALRSLIDRCLTRAVRERLRDIGDARFELRAALDSPVSPEVAKPSGLTRIAAFSMGSLLLGALATLALLQLLKTPDESPQEATWTEIGAPHRDFASHPAPSISPDGRKVAFWAPDQEGFDALWVRSLDTPGARRLTPASTEMLVGGGSVTLQPFWSPDGRSVGFFAGDELRRVDLDGSEPITLGTASNPRGGSWAPDGTIVFIPESRGPYRIPASGGDATPIDLPFEFGLVSWPHVLPDGRHFLLTASRHPGSGVDAWLSSLDGGEATKLGPVNSRMEYADGFLLFSSRGTLFAQPFDEEGLELAGEPRKIADGIGSFGGDIWASSFSVSRAGNLVYGSGTFLPRSQLTRIDRQGARIGTLGSPAEIFGFDPSPSGKQLVVETSDPAMENLLHLWLVDSETGDKFLLLDGVPDAKRPWVEGTGVWDPTGEQIVFSHWPGISAYSLTDGSVTQLHETLGWVQDVSPDGSLVLLARQLRETGNGLWLLELEEGGVLEPFLDTTAEEGSSLWSPDGRWIAYTSDASGRREVLVQSFPDPGRPEPISSEGGGSPTWRADGKELYFIAHDGTLMAVPVDGSGQRLVVGQPSPLFHVGSSLSGGRGQIWPDAEGQSFLVNLVLEDEAPMTFTVVQNWPALLVD